jgi:hypothetical protein
VIARDLGLPAVPLAASGLALAALLLTLTANKLSKQAAPVAATAPVLT